METKSRNPIECLEQMAKVWINGRELIAPVIDHPQFAICSGSAHPKHHHYGTGGLARHTYEVAHLCDTIDEQYWFDTSINGLHLFLAAVYHDVGKIWDYGMSDHEGEWVGTTHKRLIHHVSRSAIFWNEAATKLGLSDETKDKVTHCILSHHGKREYGSPVAPFSKEAWILHLCDSISARMDDCDKIDVLDKYPKG